MIVPRSSNERARSLLGDDNGMFVKAWELIEVLRRLFKLLVTGECPPMSMELVCTGEVSTIMAGLFTSGSDPFVPSGERVIEGLSA